MGIVTLLIKNAARSMRNFYSGVGISGEYSATQVLPSFVRLKKTSIPGHPSGCYTLDNAYIWSGKHGMEDWMVPSLP